MNCSNVHRSFAEDYITVCVLGTFSGLFESLFCGRNTHFLVLVSSLYLYFRISCFFCVCPDVSLHISQVDQRDEAMVYGVPVCVSVVMI